MGPAPKPDDQRARRNARPAKVYLPAAGRKGKPPAWPLASSTADELALWKTLWTMPQAVAWEAQRVERVVAQYVRWTLYAEAGAIKAAPEARQLGDRLGMSPLAMRRLEWEIVEDPSAVRTGRPARRGDGGGPGGNVVDARSMFGDLTPSGADVDAAPGHAGT